MPPKDRSQMACHICGEVGHLKADCPQRGEGAPPPGTRRRARSAAWRSRATSSRRTSGKSARRRRRASRARSAPTPWTARPRRRRAAPEPGPQRPLLQLRRARPHLGPVPAAARARPALLQLQRGRPHLQGLPEGARGDQLSAAHRAHRSPARSLHSPIPVPRPEPACAEKCACAACHDRVGKLFSVDPRIGAIVQSRGARPLCRARDLRSYVRRQLKIRGYLASASVHALSKSCDASSQLPPMYLAA